MSDCVSEVLSLYGLENAKITFLQHNENRTYQLDCKEQSFCLRLKSPVSGFDLNGQLAFIKPANHDRAKTKKYKSDIGSKQS
jgi:Ser/Thr protein kinase RdoA (MazF antagonist)